MNRILQVSVLLSLVFSFCWFWFSSPEAHESVPSHPWYADFKNYGLRLSADSIDAGQTSLLIEKSAYRLSVLRKGELLKSYPVVLGFDPVEDKKMEGDGCTPEGQFKVRSLYPHKSWSHFLWINYPNEDSYKKFSDHKATGQIPSEAAIGGEVGIHGVPEGFDYLIDQKENWTLGCIAMKIADIEELYPLVQENTPIEIRH